MPVPTAPTFRDRVHGCLLGGAVGDALGAAVEFRSIDEIRARFGPAGIADPAEAYGRVGAITDDTQMTVFTADGLIRAAVRGRTKGIVHAPTVVDHAYGRWLAALGERGGRWDDGAPDGWLVDLPALGAWRSPGRTCLSAMRAPAAGTVAAPINQSKGCGGVMRIAPVGLLDGPRDVFALGCDLAALTHGHPSGYLTAGAMALLIETALQRRFPHEKLAFDRLGKPEPHLFAQGAARLGMAPDRLVMIGDQIETDIVGARAAGCDAALLAGVSRWHSDAQHPVAPTWLLDKLWP